MTEKESWQLMLEMWEYIRDFIKHFKQYTYNSYKDSVSITQLKYAFLEKEKGLGINWVNDCYFCVKHFCSVCPLNYRGKSCDEHGSLYYRARHLDLRAVAWIIRKIKKELEKVKEEE